MCSTGPQLELENLRSKVMIKRQLLVGSSWKQVWSTVSVSKFSEKFLVPSRTKHDSTYSQFDCLAIIKIATVYRMVWALH